MAEGGLAIFAQLSLEATWATKAWHSSKDIMTTMIGVRS